MALQKLNVQTKYGTLLLLPLPSTSAHSFSIAGLTEQPKHCNEMRHVEENRRVSDEFHQPSREPINAPARSSIP
jgi:hypothetical protein